MYKLLPGETVSEERRFSTVMFCIVLVFITAFLTRLIVFSFQDGFRVVALLNVIALAFADLVWFRAWRSTVFQVTTRRVIAFVDLSFVSVTRSMPLENVRSVSRIGVPLVGMITGKEFGVITFAGGNPLSFVSFPFVAGLQEVEDAFHTAAGAKKPAPPAPVETVSSPAPAAAQPLMCPECGTEVVGDTKFCKRCGAKVA